MADPRDRFNTAPARLAQKRDVPAVWSLFNPDDPSSPLRAPAVASMALLHDPLAFSPRPTMNRETSCGSLASLDSSASASNAPAAGFGGSWPRVRKQRTSKNTAASLFEVAEVPEVGRACSELSAASTSELSALAALVSVEDRLQSDGAAALAGRGAEAFADAVFGTILPKPPSPVDPPPAPSADGAALLSTLAEAPGGAAADDAKTAMISEEDLFAMLQHDIALQPLSHAADFGFAHADGASSSRDFDVDELFSAPAAFGQYSELAELQPPIPRSSLPTGSAGSSPSSRTASGHVSLVGSPTGSPQPARRDAFAAAASDQLAWHPESSLGVPFPDATQPHVADDATPYADPFEAVLLQHATPEAPMPPLSCSWDDTEAAGPAFALGQKGTRNGAERKEWAQSEDDAIRAAVSTHGLKWRKIASLLPGRSDDAVRNRWNRLKDLAAIELAGVGAADGAAASAKAGPRHAIFVPTSHASKRKEERSLSKPERVSWSRLEDGTIVASVADFGHRWSRIAERLPGRTDHAIRNRYHRLQTMLGPNAGFNADAGASDASSSDAMLPAGGVVA